VHVMGASSQLVKMEELLLNMRYDNHIWLGYGGESVHLSISAESTNHSIIFFSHNKSANNTFSHDFLTSRQALGRAS
jgi:hypothetical protein